MHQLSVHIFNSFISLESRRWAKIYTAHHNFLIIQGWKNLKISHPPNRRDAEIKKKCIIKLKFVLVLNEDTLILMSRQCIFLPSVNATTFPNLNKIHE